MGFWFGGFGVEWIGIIWFVGLWLGVLGCVVWIDVGLASLLFFGVGFVVGLFCFGFGLVVVLLCGVLDLFAGVCCLWVGFCDLIWMCCFCCCLLLVCGFGFVLLGWFGGVVCFDGWVVAVLFGGLDDWY